MFINCKSKNCNIFRRREQIIVINNNNYYCTCDINDYDYTYEEFGLGTKWDISIFVIFEKIEINAHMGSAWWCSFLQAYKERYYGVLVKMGLIIWSSQHYFMSILRAITYFLLNLNISKMAFLTFCPFILQIYIYILKLLYFIFFSYYHSIFMWRVFWSVNEINWLLLYQYEFDNSQNSMNTLIPNEIKCPYTYMFLYEESTSTSGMVNPLALYLNSQLI